MLLVDSYNDSSFALLVVGVLAAVAAVVVVGVEVGLVGFGGVFVVAVAVVAVVVCVDGAAVVEQGVLCVLESYSMGVAKLGTVRHWGSWLVMRLQLIPGGLVR